MEPLEEKREVLPLQLSIDCNMESASQTCPLTEKDQLRIAILRGRKVPSCNRVSNGDLANLASKWAILKALAKELDRA